VAELEGYVGAQPVAIGLAFGIQPSFQIGDAVHDAAHRPHFGMEHGAIAGTEAEALVLPRDVGVEHVALHPVPHEGELLVRMVPIKHRNAEKTARFARTAARRLK